MQGEGVVGHREECVCMCVGVKRVERDWGGSVGRSSRACTSEGEVDTAFVGCCNVVCWCVSVRSVCILCLWID